MLKIAVITGSTREGRVNRDVADYVVKVANEFTQEAEFELVDILEYDLPDFNSAPPLMLNKQYDDPKITKWSEKIEEFDGYIFVTPEYNKNTSPALLNAICLLGGEWTDKAASIVGYGSTDGITAIQVLRITLSNLGLAVQGKFANFNIFTDWQNGEFKPQEYREATVELMVAGLVKWAKAIKTIR